MATTVATLQARLDADTGRFDRAMHRTDSTFSKIGRNIGRVALAAGAAVATALGITAKIGFDEFSQHAEVVAQTNAALKSTGRVAGVTAKDIDRMAQSLMHVSGIDDELIQQSENLLLTFRSVRNEVGKGNDIFNQATKAILDVSVAFHKDLNSSTVMVGKALQDPIRGLTALRRVGIQFTEGQEKMIKKMVESGHVMEAQKLILGELQRQAGGSAAALGETLTGKLNILKETFRDMAGELVGAAIPALMAFSGWVTDHMPQIQRTFEVVFGVIGRVVGEAVGFVRGLLFSSGTDLDRYGNEVTHTVLRFRHEFNVMKDVAMTVFNAVKGFILGTLVPAFFTLRDKVREIVAAVVGVFKKHRKDLLSIWESLSSVIADVWAILQNQLLPLIRKVLPAAIDKAIPIIRDLATGLATVAGWARSAASAIEAVVNAIHSLPGGGVSLSDIKGPSLKDLLKQHGGPVSAGSLYIVGEKGPELFVPDRSGTIVPNRVMGSSGMIVPSGGGSTVYNFNGAILDGEKLLAFIRNQSAQFQRTNGRPAF